MLNKTMISYMTAAASNKLYGTITVFVLITTAAATTATKKKIRIRRMRRGRRIKEETLITRKRAIARAKPRTSGFWTFWVFPGFLV